MSQDENLAVASQSKPRKWHCPAQSMGLPTCGDQGAIKGAEGDFNKRKIFRSSSSPSSSLRNAEEEKEKTHSGAIATKRDFSFAGTFS